MSNKITEKKIIIFTEEYFKATTGMFNVVLNLSDSLKKEKINTRILVNNEHWSKNNNLIRLPSLSIVQNIKKYFYNLRNKFLVFKIIIFLITRLFIPIDFIVFNIYLFKKFSFLKPDIINIHNGGWPGWLSRIIIIPSYFLGIKIIYSIHNLRQKTNFFESFYHDLLFKFYSFFIYKYVFVSKFLKNDFKKFKISYSIIYNAPFFKKNNFNRIKLDISKNKLNVGFVGSISNLKKTIDILKVLLYDKKKEILVHHIGYIDNAYCKKNNIDIDSNKFINYKFYGFQKNVLSFYDQVDVVVATSKAYESFGLVVIEAMRLNKPVIATDYGPFKELIINNYNGFLYNPENVKDFYSKLNSYIDNNELINQHGINGYNRYQKKFTVKAFKNSYINVFNS